MKNKKFDCVEMMHQGAILVQQKIEGMTVAEELAYWRQQTAELRKLQRETKEKEEGHL